MSYFVYVPGAHIGYYDLFNCSVFWIVLNLSNFLMNMRILRNTHLVLCRTSLNWDAYDVFLMVRVRLCILGRKTTEVKPHSLHITSRVFTIKLVITSDVKINYLTEIVFVKVFHYEVTLLFSPLSILYPLEGSHSVQPTIMECRAMFHFLEGGTSA